MVTPEIKTILLSSLPFKYLNSNELDMLMHFCKVITFDAGNVVIEQGKRSDGMYVIVEGNASVTAKVLGKDDLNIATLEKGTFIGEISLIEKGPFTASVTADNELQCLVFTTTYYEMLSTFYPDIKFKIAKAICEVVCMRLRILHKKITTLMTHCEMHKRSFFSEAIKSLTKPENITFESAHLSNDRLHNLPIFKSFSNDDMEVILKYFELISVAQNCNLITEGETGTPYFYILYGAIQSSIIENNKIAKLTVLGPMSLLGSISYIDGTSAIINYTSCEKAILLKISAENLNLLQKDYIHLWYKLYDLICENIITLERSADKLLIRLSSEIYNYV